MDVDLGNSWTGFLLALAILVVVPQAAALAGFRPLLPRATVAAAVAAAFSSLLDPDRTSMILAVPWVLVGTVAAAVGVARLVSRHHLEPAIALDAALVYLGVGAGWLVLSRAGANPLGFSDQIVFLTAVHFHYAGFALPVIAGVAAERLASRGQRWEQSTRVVSRLVVIGVSLTAIGITVGGTIEWVAATVMALGGLATAGLVGVLARAGRGLGRLSLACAAASLSLGMALALGWAWSRQFGWAYLDLDGMARWHGTFNALGFGLLGVVGLRLAGGDRVPDLHCLVHVGRPSPTRLEAVAADAKAVAPLELGAERPAVGAVHSSVTLPGGFVLGREALLRWAGHEAAGIEVVSTPRIEVGATVMIIPAGPLSVTAMTRVVEVTDEPNRFGFTYATLHHHPFEGVETFMVEEHPDGSATYTIGVAARPAALMMRSVPWVASVMQRRAVARNLRGVVRSLSSAQQLSR